MLAVLATVVIGLFVLDVVEFWASEQDLRCLKKRLEKARSQNKRDAEDRR